MRQLKIYLLDIGSGYTLLSGLITGQQIAIFLGGLASIVAIINHTDQYLTRRYERKHGKKP